MLELRRGRGLRATLIGGLLLVGAPANAADLLLHRGESPIVVVARVAPLAAVKPSALQPRSVREVFANQPPAIVGGGTVRACSGESTTAMSLETMLEKAEEVVAYMESTALEDLDAAVNAIVCLEEAVPIDAAARIHFLLGITAHRLGREEESQQAFRQALLFDPTLTWDDNFAPMSRPLFESALESLDEVPSVPVDILPLGERGTVRLDGRTVRAEQSVVSVSAGPHLIQVEGRYTASAWVTLDEGTEPTLVVAGALPMETVEWADDSELQPRLLLVLSALVGLDKTVYVATRRGTYRVNTGAGEWKRIGDGSGVEQVAPEEEPVSVPAIPDPVEKIRRKPGAIAYGGAGLFAVGAVLGGVSYAGVRGARNDAVEAGDIADYEDASRRYEGAATRLYVSYAITGVGAALGGAGFALQINGRGAGLQLGWRY